MIRDIKINDTFDHKFTTRAFATGVPTTLGGTPVISAYPGNSTTQLTAGITLSVDFDAVTGLNNIRVVATTGNGYADDTDYALIITTGTVGGTSVVGEVIAHFRTGKEPSYSRLGAPAGASVSADIADVEGKVDDLEGRVGTPSDLGSGASLAANFVDVEGQTDDIASKASQASVDAIDNFVDTEITDIQNRLPVTLVSGRMDSSIGAVASGVIAAASFAAGAFDAVWTVAVRVLTAGTNIVLAKGTGITGFNDLSAAQVNTEVVDVLDTNTSGEPAQGAPPVTASIRTKLDWIFTWIRNKKDNDGTTTKLYADDGATVVAKQTTSDAAGTSTVNEWVSGP